MDITTYGWSTTTRTTSSGLTTTLRPCRVETRYRRPVPWAKVRPMRGLKRIRSAQVVCSGHAFVQNLRRGHYVLGLDTEPGRRLEAVFTELALAI